MSLDVVADARANGAGERLGFVLTGGMEKSRRTLSLRRDAALLELGPHRAARLELTGEISRHGRNPNRARS